MKKHLSSEHGVFVPLAAVVLAGAITLLFATGVDSLLIRLTRSELQRTTNQICLSLTSEALAPDFAAPAFRDSVMALKDGLSFATLDGATLVLPAQKERPFATISPTQACVGTLPSVDEVGADPAPLTPAWTTFGSISDAFPTCALDAEDPADRDCKLWSYPNSALPPGFPESAKSALLPGRSVGCILSARVKRYAGGPPVRIWGRALYSARLRNPGDYLNGPTPSALRIAIGTEMSTPDFRRLVGIIPSGQEILDRKSPLTFAAVENAEAFSPPLSNLPDSLFWNHDPFCGPPSSPEPNSPWCLSYRTVNRAKFLDESVPGNFLSAFSEARPITPKSRISAQGYPLPGEKNPGFLRGGWKLSDSQIKEMLAACSNPPALIRNILSQTFVELAARDPALRNRTEVLHVNPRSSNLNSPPNPPTQMVPLGVDITSPSFQIPFISYVQENVEITSGQKLELLVGLGESVSKISPFSATDDLLDDEQRIHATLATQLRACYHLYTGQADGASISGPTKGLSRIYSSKLFDSPHRLLRSQANSAFEFSPQLYPGLGSEPVAYGYETLEPPSSPRLPSDIYKVPPSNTDPMHFYPQEQESPWVTPWTGTFTRLLSAGELVSVLGSSQRCPYSDLGDPGTAADAPRPDGRFMKRCPSTPPGSDLLTPPGIYPSKDDFYAPEIADSKDTVGELLPDIRGLFTYLDPPPAAEGPLLLRSPGLSHPALPAPAELGQAPCANSSLIVILNSMATPQELSPTSNQPPWALQDFPYLDSLSGQIADFRIANPRTPIIFIYIPATPFQSQSRIIDDILPKLLSRHEQDSLQDPYTSLLVLAPPCGKGKKIGAYTVCKESELHDYWRELLDPDSEKYIVPMARRLFLERFYQVERVL